MARKLLDNAKKSKKDEFYTQLSDIEKELRHYKSQFKNKVVYCNADDPYESNFFRFFAANFNNFQLKKLIATCYSGSPIVGSQLPLFDIKGLKSNGKESFKIEINKVEDSNNDGSIDMSDVEWLLKHNENTVTPLKQGGDFRSKECIDLLKQSDIVCTNPPFSLFREYLAQLIEFNKKFLIIGNTNSLTYKEIFKLFKDNKIRTGYTNFNVGMFFVVPNDWKQFHHIDEKGNKIARVSTSCWFTNLDVERHKEFLTLYKRYNSKEYLKYDNYDAINVDKISDIPMDYEGVVGVPITFMDKYNPEQFEIIKFRKGDDDKDLCINGKCPYFRILIRKKKV
ncbi:MAG: adenine-specific methyltransferase EcoRI family protein [Nanoarchaeota archaeon]